MARRGGGAWRVPGNPMAGVMRDAVRQTRKGRRRAAAAPQDGTEPAAPDEAASSVLPEFPDALGDPGPETRAAIAVTDADGRASWTYSEAFSSVPVVAATVQNDDTSTGVALFAVIETVTQAAVTVRVWRAPAEAAPGVAAVALAGADIDVHLTATPVRA